MLCAVPCSWLSSRDYVPEPAQKVCGLCNAVDKALLFDAWSASNQYTRLSFLHFPSRLSGCVTFFSEFNSQDRARISSGRQNGKNKNYILYIQIQCVYYIYSVYIVHVYIIS